LFDGDGSGDGGGSVVMRAGMVNDGGGREVRGTMADGKESGLIGRMDGEGMVSDEDL
jgi:hypothetical protein